jgi:hypothetical protein
MQGQPLGSAAVVRALVRGRRVQAWRLEKVRTATAGGAR